MFQALVVSIVFTLEQRHYAGVCTFVEYNDFALLSLNHNRVHLSHRIELDHPDQGESNSFLSFVV